MDKKQKLEELRNKMKSDQSLPLRQGATNLAFGDGDPESELLFTSLLGFNLYLLPNCVYWYYISTIHRF